MTATGSDFVDLRSAPSCKWEACEGSSFSVRGKDYMSTRVKVDSAESLYECRDVKFVRGANGKITAQEIYLNLEADGKVKSEEGASVSSSSMACDGSGGCPSSPNVSRSLPEILVINSQMPWDAPSLMFSASKEDFGASMISFHELKEKYNNRGRRSAEASPAVDLFRRMLDVGISQRNGISFKAIGFCETWENLGLPDAVKGYNGKPALVTDSAKIFCKNNVCIIDFDVRLWSYLAKQSLHAVFSNPALSRNNTLRLGYLVEGKSSQELPEQMLAAFYISNIDREGLPIVDAGVQDAENGADQSGGFLKKMFG